MLVAEMLLAGAAPDAELFQAAAAAAALAIEPSEDTQADARYRRELAQVMIYRALARACCMPGAWA
jgi:CO/xanthine dehydrogenase FAD-binding subunit